MRPTLPAAPPPVRRTHAIPSPRVVGAFLLLALAYHVVFGAYFPLPNGLMGHDYSGTLPGIMDGVLWFRNNGILSPPWFTPSFCGGQAAFADPHSGFYSVEQFLAFFNPVERRTKFVLGFNSPDFTHVGLHQTN